VNGIGTVVCKNQKYGRNCSPIVRLILVRVVPEETQNATDLERELCIQQPAVLRRNCSRQMMIRENSFPIQERKDQQSIDAYKSGEAHEEIKKMRDICTEISHRSNGIKWSSRQAAYSRPKYPLRRATVPPPLSSASNFCVALAKYRSTLVPRPPR
jgi:hypothetical protein